LEYKKDKTIKGNMSGNCDVFDNLQQLFRHK